MTQAPSLLGGVRRHLERRYGAQASSVSALWESGNEGLYRLGASRVARIFAPSRPLERVEGDGAVLEFVERHAVPAERLVRSVDGERATSFDGHGVLVTTFVVGASPALDGESLRPLGVAAGRIAALPVGAEPFVSRTAGSLPAEDLAAARKSLSAVPVSSEGERLLAALEGTRDCEDLPRGLVHPDVHPGNAIRTRRGEVALIDWTGAGCGPRIAMLGWLLYSSAMHGRGEDGPDLSRLRPVIDGYREHHKPSVAELDRLPDAVRVRPLALAVRAFVTSGQSSWRFADEHVLRVVEEARRLFG